MFGGVKMERREMMEVGESLYEPEVPRRLEVWSRLEKGRELTRWWWAVVVGGAEPEL